jgi:uncharacterized coiled-coil protein SlyX
MSFFKNPFKKKKETERLSKAGSTVVKVSVQRIIGSGLRTEVLKFDALQDRDNAGNIIIKNEEYDFREDLDFVKEKVIEDLEYRLALISGTKETKINKINDAIKEQETRIKNIRDGKLTLIEDNKEVQYNVNPIDEDVKLTQLKVLRDSLKLDGKGVHEFIDVNGFRVYDYKFEDGVLFPIVYHNKENSLSPDKTAKRKNYRSEQDLINTEYLEDKSSPFSGFGRVIMWVLFIVLFAGNIWWAMDNSARSSEITEQWDESNIKKLIEASELSTIQCASYLATSAEVNQEIVEWAKAELLRRQNNINTGNIIDAR